MDYSRRLHQSSYPPRPSPLGASHDSRTDPTGPYGASLVGHEPRSRPEADKARFTTRYGYLSPNSTSTISPTSVRAHQWGTSRAPHSSFRGPTASASRSPPRSQYAPQLRRHGSLEMRHHSHSHRRNHSQPHPDRENVGLLGSLRDMNHTSQHDPVRRTSGSPVFPAPHEHSAPPSFGNRQMPPPSPPRSYSMRAQSANAPAAAPSRDVSSGQAHRPGSSMSISAMLGSDPERPARESGSSFFTRPSASSIFGNAPPSTTPAAMSPPTAPTRPSPLEHSLFRRSHTPEKPFSRPQMGRPYRSGSGGGSSLTGEPSKFGGLSRASASHFPDKPHSTHPSPHISSAEPPYTEPRRTSLSGPIARPSSQPPHAEALTRPPGYSPLSQPTGAPDRSFEAGPRSASSSYMGLDSHHGRFGNIFGDRHSEDPAHRDRDRSSDIKAPRYGAHYGERDPLERHSSASTWEHGRSYPPSPESKRFPAPESGSGFGFGAIQSYTKSLGSQPGGGRQPPSLQSRHSQPTLPHEASYLGKPQTHPRLGSTPATSLGAGPTSFGLASATDDGRRKGSDELLQHRSLLAVGAEGKRGGRASPIPQAVQGAQAPFIGPTGESGIKNELGRVFSGIGSGVGGVTAPSAGSGPPTPLNASPFKRDSFTGRSLNGETMDEARIPRPTSATGGRRSRKSRDEEAQLELEAADLRAGLSGRGTRRARHAHHHHHHHHHHRHKAEEEAAALSALHRPVSTNFFHQTSTPAEAGHHHHHHHHHHHAPRLAVMAVASPMREPRTTVNLDPILSSVAHLPRHHLGSTLYTPRIDVPTGKASLDSAKFGYTSTPQPLPHLERRENCTFTVRVPRFRVTPNRREEICVRRALWGTGVYTDDSDPVAAAIHSGFIRGSWAEEVDESMLDLEIKDTYQHAPPPSTDASKSEGPRLPPVPPPDQDLHITLLVLPRLERYDSTVMFGLRSRKFDGRHDGMSFKVQRVDWVDEGVGRGEERSGQARRKRLRTLMQTGRICTGAAMAKTDELRRNGMQVPRTINSPNQPAAVQPVS